MSKTTRATQTLTQLGVAFTLHSYNYDPDADSIGLQAAEALGAEPHRVLKTLMAEVDGNPVCVIVPSDCEVSMKKLASAFGGKAAKMMRPADAERLTVYIVCGISPFGQKKRVPTAMEVAALGEESEAGDEQREGKNEDEELQQQPREPGPLKILHVVAPVEQFQPPGRSLLSRFRQSRGQQEVGGQNACRR